MSTQTTEAPRLPIIIKRFSSAAANVTVKRWPDRDTEHGKEAGAVFLEISQDTGKPNGKGGTIWNQIQVQLADVSGVLETINRAKNLGISTEDGR
jgi:hypothetical protein